MKIHSEFCLEKKLGKYIFSKDLKISKRNKSKSPSEKNIFFPLTNDDDKSFLFESKLKIGENPFLSTIKKNPNFTMRYYKENDDNFMNLRSRIIIKDNIADFIENNLEFYENNLNLFDNDFIYSDILSNEEILSSDLENNKVNNDKKEDNKNNKANNISGDLIDKEKIVLDALTSFDKDYINNKTNNYFMINYEDFDSEREYISELLELNIKDYYSEEKKIECEQKRNISDLIDKRIKLYYNYYKKNKSYKIEETENEAYLYKSAIKQILTLESLNECNIFFCFKSLVLSLYILIINWLSNSHIKVYIKSITEDSVNLNIFIELMEKYNTIKDICPFLEKDFKDIIENYQIKNNIKFCLCELLTDLYWDYIFKIHSVNNMFTSCYKLDNVKNNVIFEEAKHAMKTIVDILIVNDIPYKKNIGEQLKLPYIKNENIFLMSYINKSKKILNPFEIKNPFIEEKDKNSKDNKNSSNNEKINLKEIINIDNLNSKEIKNEKNINEENKCTDNYSLEEMYKYIVGDNNCENSKPKKKNKNKKKKRKNKKEKVKDEEEEEVDPVVQDFIQFLKELNQEEMKYTKIKPYISEEWIKSLS